MPAHLRYIFRSVIPQRIELLTNCERGSLILREQTFCGQGVTAMCHALWLCSWFIQGILLLVLFFYFLFCLLSTELKLFARIGKGPEGWENEQMTGNRQTGSKVWITQEEPNSKNISEVYQNVRVFFRYIIHNQFACVIIYYTCILAEKVRTNWK